MVDGRSFTLCLAAAALSACSGGGPSACNAACPLGCSVSADCRICIPDFAGAGLGSDCRDDRDCCTGVCGSRHVCVVDPASVGSSRGAAGTGGGAKDGGCASWTSAPDLLMDAACNPNGGRASVCSPWGACISSCLGQPWNYCGQGAVCAANGHCEPPGGWGGADGGGPTTAGGWVCGETGVASCTGPTGPRDCCSQYCVEGTCHCNVGGDVYPCVSDEDCCRDSSRGCGPDGNCL